MDRVLIADTDESVCEVIQACLEEEYSDVIVTCVHSGSLARAALQAGHFDLLVMEAVLPEVCGFRLAEQAASRDIPVLLMSGDLATQDDLDACGYPYLDKPFVLREMISVMRCIRSDPAENICQVRMATARRREAEDLSSGQDGLRGRRRSFPGEGLIEAPPPNILLVEADRATRDGLWTNLEEAGYTVIAAASFEEAWLLLETTRWDLLLTAIDLHGRSGSQLALQARTKGTPAIFIADNVVPFARRMAGPRHGELLAQVTARVRAFAQSPPRQAA
ncbi:MAG: response regulator transcription factor [Acetobacteraceae bacterium]